jgi:hypothetical protein
VACLSKVGKVATYFPEPGSENTDNVDDEVARRDEEGDVEAVVVASTSGNTGAKVTEALKDKAEVTAASHEKMRAELKEKTLKLGRIAFT